MDSNSPEGPRRSRVSSSDKKKLANLGSIVLAEDEESLREEEEARRAIRLHLMHSGFAKECAQAGNRRWSDESSSDDHMLATRGRRSGQTLNGFTKDAVVGLESENFSLDKNLATHDERPGLDDECASEISSIMANSNCSFDEARLELTRRRMREAGIDPDTGLPLDPKTLLPSDCDDVPRPTSDSTVSSGSNDTNGSWTKLDMARNMMAKLWSSSG